MYWENIGEEIIENDSGWPASTGKSRNTLPSTSFSFSVWRKDYLGSDRYYDTNKLAKKARLEFRTSLPRPEMRHQNRRSAFLPFGAMDAEIRIGWTCCAHWEAYESISLERVMFPRPVQKNCNQGSFALIPIILMKVKSSILRLTTWSWLSDPFCSLANQ